MTTNIDEFVKDYTKNYKGNANEIYFIGKVEEDEYDELSDTGAFYFEKYMSIIRMDDYSIYKMDSEVMNYHNVKINLKNGEVRNGYILNEDYVEYIQKIKEGTREEARTNLETLINHDRNDLIKRLKERYNTKVIDMEGI